MTTEHISLKSIKQNKDSIYLIDKNNNLYVSGNNKNGRLGIDEVSEYIGKITKVVQEELIENVASVNILDTNQNYELVTITTIDGKVFVAGNTGNEIIRKWTNKENILTLKGLSYTVLGNFKHASHELEISVSEKLTYLFTVVPENNTFTLRLGIRSSNIVSEILFSNLTHEDNYNSFIEYSVVRDRNFKIGILRKNGKLHFYALNSIDPENDIVLSEIIKFNFTNFASEVIYDDEVKESIIAENFEEIDSETEKLIMTELKEGDFFSTDQGRVTSDKINTKTNTIKIKVSLADKVEEAFEDSTVKGTPWLYDFLHKKLGLNSNTLYKFEGYIKCGEKYHGISYVRVSDKVGSTDQGADIGTVQFILSTDNKIPYSERHKEESGKNDLVFGITIHPIVKNGEIYQFYAESDNLDKAILDEEDPNTKEIKLFSITEVDGLLITNEATPLSYTQNFNLS